MVYDLTITIAFKFIDLLHNSVISYIKLVMEFVGVNGLNAKVCGLAEFYV